MRTPLVTYPVLLLAFLGFASLARADIEAPQTVIGTVKTVIEEARAVQEDLNEIQSDLRSAAEGVAGPVKNAVKTVNDVKNEAESNIAAAKDKVDAAKNATSDPEGALSTMGSKMPGFITEVDTNDQEKVTEAVKKNYFAQKPKTTSDTSSNKDGAAAEETDSVKIAKEHEAKMNEIQRENFANLYAQAFAIRTNLAKEKEEDKKHENSRDIIQNTKDMAMKMNKRYRKLLIMEAALYEFRMSQQARQFSFTPEEEDGDE